MLFLFLAKTTILKKKRKAGITVSQRSVSHHKSAQPQHSLEAEEVGTDLADMQRKNYFLLCPKPTQLTFPECVPKVTAAKQPKKDQGKGRSLECNLVVSRDSPAIL